MTFELEVDVSLPVGELDFEKAAKDEDYVMSLIEELDTFDIPPGARVRDVEVDIEHEEIHFASSRQVEHIPTWANVSITLVAPMTDHPNCRSTFVEPGTPTETSTAIPVAQCVNCEVFVCEAGEKYVVEGDRGETYCSIDCLNEVYVK